MQSRLAEVDGIRMRWEEQGEGQPVILLHGIPTCPALWRHVMPRLEGARALAWEMVGYGASIPEGRDRDISVSRQADYLAAWMRQTGLERAVLVGHDLGGGVAQILAVRRPELVRGLVLMNSICYDSWPILSVKLLRALGGVVERLPEPTAALNIGTLLFRGHDDRRCARESFRQHYRHYASHGGAAALIRQIRSLDVGDTLAVADRIPDLRVPARLVWGAADQFQKIGYGYRLAYELRAPIDRIEGGKHFVPEDHAGRVAAAINDLLEQTARDG
ncbi:MAG: alpha/beta fold hydrolase [Gemmatimonadota bacterium]|nr:alpha/beta fold hydrolase [Gemmatimonadota bacterium]